MDFPSFSSRSHGPANHSPVLPQSEGVTKEIRSTEFLSEILSSTIVKDPHPGRARFSKIPCVPVAFEIK
jgi:hypothetical protein